MKNLDIFKKEIKSCSRCGLCMAVCPVYQITKNDCTSPRGKLILLDEILKSNINPSKKIKSYMDMCIECGKCTLYCPGKIDMEKINNAFNNDYPYFSFNIMSLPILIRYLLNIFVPKNFLKNKIYQTKKIVYVMPYKEREIPAIIKKSNCAIINDCGIPMKFAISNPKLYIEIAKIVAKKVLETKSEIILTDNILCKTELDTGLFLLGVKRKIYYISD